jgi:hypothetical protein
MTGTSPLYGASLEMSAFPIVPSRGAGWRLATAAQGRVMRQHGSVGPGAAFVVTLEYEGFARHISEHCFGVFWGEGAIGAYVESSVASIGGTPIGAGILGVSFRLPGTFFFENLENPCGLLDGR